MALIINQELLDSYKVTLSRKFDGAFAAAPAAEWQKIATQIESGSSRNDYSWLGELSSMKRWLGKRILEALRTFKYSIENEEWELTMAVKRTEIEDDQGGLFPVLGSRAEILARAAARQPDELIWQQTLAKGEELACYDGQSLFDVSHGVGQPGTQHDVSNLLGTGANPAWYIFDTSRPIKPLIFQNRKTPEFVGLFDLTNPNVFYNREFVYGVDSRNAAGFGLWQTSIKSTEPLNEENFTKARRLMASYTNDEGVKLGLRADLLVVPQELEDVARKMLTVELLPNLGSNYLRGATELHVSKYL